MDEVRTTRFTVTNKCEKPEKPQHGTVLCNNHELATGAECLLECEYGYVATGPELTTCNQVLQEIITIY